MENVTYRASAYFPLALLIAIFVGVTLSQHYELHNANGGVVIGGLFVVLQGLTVLVVRFVNKRRESMRELSLKRR